MIPPKPLITSAPQGQWDERLRQEVRQNKLLPGRGYRLRPTAGGTYLDIEAGLGGGAAGGPTIAVFQAATGLTGWLQQDYLLAYKVGSDGAADTGTTYKIAKPWRTRGSVASEVIGGVTYSYAADSSGTTRTVTWTYSGTGYSEAQVIIPPWVASENILAMKLDYTGVTVDGADVGWLAIQDGSKAWMKRNA